MSDSIYFISIRGIPQIIKVRARSRLEAIVNAGITVFSDIEFKPLEQAQFLFKLLEEIIIDRTGDAE